MRTIAAPVGVTVCAIALGACQPTPPPPPLARPADPVVITADRLPALQGVPVGSVVAFTYPSNRWVQIPVQVDQRKTVELNTVYGQPANTTGPVNVVVYADPNTWVGGGSGVVGALDEIVFMAKDVTTSSAAPPYAEPTGVVHGSGTQLTITDPLRAGRGSVYLFRQNGSLDPAAGQDYVNYTFSLASGDYKTTYGFAQGPNPEISRIVTPSYTRHFSDRWADDQLTVNVPGASGVDLLDRDKALFAPGNCVRSEDTFDAGEGAFIANVNGPVRAIRSYIGANSGPYTERTHVFYAAREDIVTDLRVHQIPSGILSFFDYSPDASGMRYTNDRNTAGVTVDGVPDSLTAGFPTWEKVDGAQGALTHVWQLSTSIASLPRTNYYLDDAANPVTQCTGDADAYGSSGQWINGNIPNTDPHNGAAATLSVTNSLLFEAPGRTTAQASTNALQVINPLAVAVEPWAES